MTLDRGELMTLVLEHYGGVVPEGSGYRPMRCPFHEDQHRSATANLDTGHFRCFACDARGDPYDLIKFKEGVGFRAAFEFASRLAGGSDIEVPGARGRGDAVSRGSRVHRGSRRYVPPGRRRRS